MPRFVLRFVPLPCACIAIGCLPGVCSYYGNVSGALSLVLFFVCRDFSGLAFGSCRDFLAFPNLFTHFSIFP